MTKKMENQTEFEFCKELEEGYTVVSNSVYNCGLSYGAIGMYTAIIVHKNQKGWKVYQSTLVTEKDGRTKVSNYMQELMQVGLVERFDIREYGRFKGYKYIINARPTQSIANVEQEETLEQEQLCVDDYPECIPQEVPAPKSVLPTSVEQPLENKDTNKIKKEKYKKEKKIDVIEEKFNQLWSMYPKKIGKQQAKKAFVKHTKKDYSIEQFEKAINNYLSCIAEYGTNPNYFIHGGNFFSTRFEDYLEIGWSADTVAKVDTEKQKKDNLFDELFN